MNDKLTLVQSYLQWWEMAGFDHAVDENNINWLEVEAPKPLQPVGQNESPTSSPHANMEQPPKAARGQTASTTMPNAPIDIDNLPKTLDEFHDILRSGDNLPGNMYGSAKALPRTIKAWRLDKDGNAEQSRGTLMLIGDIPNDQDVREKTIFSGKQNNLIVNMMTACGFDAFDVYCTNIASTKPQFDELPEQDLPSLHALLRHHIALVNPIALISLGSACCNALLNAELMKSRENLHYFNHNNNNTALIATFHPRSLIAKPQLKRQAWRDLQVLMKKDIL